MLENEKLRIIRNIEFHRNGISGVGFYIVLFYEIDENNNKKEMIAIVFKTEKHVAIFNKELLNKNVIKFKINSFRGDLFEKGLREDIANWEKDNA